ncbi:hypothetical protein WJX73_009987 [Symbiochloris irregularis]|uniref:Uncharacterized protein n=1 Tax=Symbiochloris irregularis TaxID=706552 RepID=A0AAW1PS55_9CHLO
MADLSARAQLSAILTDKLPADSAATIGPAHLDKLEEEGFVSQGFLAALKEENLPTPPFSPALRQLLLLTFASQPGTPLVPVEKRPRQVVDVVRQVATEVLRVLAPQRTSRSGFGQASLLPSEAVREDLLWTHEVLAHGLASHGNIDVQLPAARPLLVQLRWLQLLLDQSSYKEVAKLVDMRKDRQVGQPDLEAPYHAIALHILKAAARGQAGLQFAAQPSDPLDKAGWGLGRSIRS